MRTVIRVFGTYDSIAIPSSWAAWTFQGVAYRRLFSDQGDVIIVTVEGDRFVWSDDGTRWGWVALDAPAPWVSTSPITDQVLPVR